MVHDRRVEVFWARDVPEAHRVRALLDDAGIAATVQGEMLQEEAGGSPLVPAMAPRVSVPEGTEARARLLIADWKERGRQEGDDAPVGPPPPPPPPAQESRRRGPLRAVLVFLACFGGQVVVGLAVGIYAGVSGRPLDELNPLIYLAAALGGWIGVYVGTRLCFGGKGAGGKGTGRIPAALGWVGTTRRHAVTATAVGCAWACLFFVTAAWILPFEGGRPDTAMSELMQSSWFGFFVWAALLVVFAPATEELLFRGAMLFGFMQRWGAVPSVIVVTLLFTALHIPETMHYWPALVFIGGLGVGCAVFRLRTGSLVPALLLHLAYNLTIVVRVLLSL